MSPRSAGADVATLSDAELADEHRGQVFAKTRAGDRLGAIEAELERRGVTRARGKVSLLVKRPNEAGLVDLKRLRAEQPEICARYAMSALWSSRTLRPEEREAPGSAERETPQ